jgi:hypothetical protein
MENKSSHQKVGSEGTVDAPSYLSPKPYMLAKILARKTCEPEMPAHSFQ